MKKMKSWDYFLALSSITAVICYSYGTSIPYTSDPRIIFFVPLSTKAQLLSSGIGSNLLGLPGQICSSKNIFTGEIETGTCRKHLHCLLSGQRLSGGCTLGLATCCVPRHRLFVNPVPISSQTYRIKPLSSYYCQVRFDFETLTLEDPDIDGNCVSGKLTFSGQKDPSVPIICGQNSGHHMYLSFNNNDPITMSITTSSDTSAWKVKATKILCSDKVNLAPSGCLQYYRGNTGSVMSFNYRNSGTSFANQLSNQNYKICLDATTGATSITWSRPSSSIDHFFTLSGNPNAIATPPVGSFLALTFGAEQCPNDYVIIKSGVFDFGLQTMLNADRFCGLGFPTGGIKAPLPFEMQYVTNGVETADGDVNNNGFFLTYTLT